jgi:hypothetical protein
MAVRIDSTGEKHLARKRHIVRPRFLRRFNARDEPVGHGHREA